MPLQKAKLSNRPKDSDAHIQADYVELLCLASLGKAIAKYDILGDYQTEAELDVNLVEEDGLINVEPALSDDKKMAKVNELFEQFSFRSTVFHEFYPFEIVGDHNILRLRLPVEEVTVKQKLYIFLLIASSLRIFDRSTEQTITTGFEVVSLAALKQYLPSNAIAKLFGKNSLGTKEKEPSLLADKIRELAKDIREKVHVDLDKEFKKSNTGDRGLDIVAWLPTGDDAPGLILAFGQCACTLDWVTKQHSSSYESWHTIINFTARPNNMIFIPFCFRDAGGIWLRETEIHSSIVFDRLRIVKLLWEHDGRLENLPYEIVDELLSHNEPLPEMY